MAMNANNMKNFIIKKLDNEAGNANAANKKFGNAVLEYIVDNMEITYSWSATNPSSGTRDPATSFEAILSGKGTLTPSSSFADFLIKLAAFIKANVIISPASGFSVGPLLFNPVGVITVSMKNEKSQDAAMLSFCTQIIASLISSFSNPESAPGSHLAFVGATTRMTIA